ncbi:MAG: M13 family metallopeptidase [Vicinamibacterales bacterium]
MRTFPAFTASAVLLSCVAACSPSAPAADPASRASGIVQASMDPSIRPQDDMFRHVNGAWLAATEIPADKASWGSFDILANKAQSDLRAIAEDAAKQPARAPGSDAQKIGDFYTSFMDEARAERLGLEPLEAELAAIDRIQSKTDLARHFARFSKLNLINPVLVYVDPDARDPQQQALTTFQGGLGLPDRDYYLKDDEKLKEYREKYVTFLSTILGKTGVSSPGAAARDIFVLETEMARAHWTNVENRDAVKTYNKLSTADLAARYPGFDWSAWLAELGVSEVPSILVNQPSFLEAFAAIVDKTPVERWKPYLKASLVNGFAPFLSAEYVDLEFDFYRRTLRGVAENQPRWKRAVNTLNGTMGEMLGKLYVEKHFTPAAKARMEQLVENLRQAYRAGIDELDWMSPDTKQQAQAKLAKFRPKIGYPNTWRDYSAVDVKPDDLVGNLLRAYTAESEYQLAKAGKAVDPEEWGMTPQTVNAYYHPVRNEIVFPAAILQPPFFDMAADDAVNYGGIGAVIGHEMGHGFDDQGRNFDADGVLRDWWTKADADEYMKRAGLVVEQFNRLEPLPGLHVNGELTLGENLADLTGLTIAHRAYLLSLGGQPAPTLDGFTGDQRFYMGWAHAWAGKMRDDMLRQLVMTNPHSPDQYRANEPLRNIPEFYSAFDVKEGDGMFMPPAERAKIW